MADLEPYALTTLEKAADYLGLDPVADIDDRTLDRLTDTVNSCSAAVLEFASREFAPMVPASDDDPAVARIFFPSRDGFISLAPYDLRSVESIVIEGSTEPLDPSMYTLMPLNGFRWTGTYGWIELKYPRSWFYGYDWPTWTGMRHLRPKVAITGRWGCKAIPAVAAKATLIAIFHDWYSPGGFGSTQDGPYSYTEEQDSEPMSKSLPWEARALLIPHLRPVVGSE